MVNKIKISFVVLSLVVFAGCGRYDGDAVRLQTTQDYQKSLAADTNNIMSSKTVFDLNDCIQTALKNGLEVRSAQIQQKIATLERKISFAAFLPAINLSYDSTRWNRQPLTRAGATTMATHDQSVRNLTWQMEMSIFDPSTWFIYAMHKRGEESAQFVTKYTEQMTMLEVTVDYYHCLTLQQAQQAMQSYLNAARELEKEVGELFKEGLVTQWQYEQIQVAVLARQTELSRIEYAIKQANADLLVSMGLSPMAEITLKIDEPLPEPTESLEDMIYKALIENPQMSVADRQVAISEEKVKIAFAAFLPRLTIFANATNTSDSFQVYQNFWTYGLEGTLSVFNGFANINSYKAAKERKKAAFIDREQQMLSMILQVYKAYLNLENAKEEAILSQKSFNAELEHFKEVNEKWKEGLVQSSDMLSVMAEKDNSQMELMNSNFNLQVCIATLQNLMGTIGEQGGKN